MNELTLEQKRAIYAEILRVNTEEPMHPDANPLVRKAMAKAASNLLKSVDAEMEAAKEPAQ